MITLQIVLYNSESINSKNKLLGSSMSITLALLFHKATIRYKLYLGK